MDERTRPLSPRVAAQQTGRELREGEHVGPWIVTRAIARGRFGTVYEVQHAHSREPAALKLLHAHLSTSTEMLARFDREIQVIGRLRHPNIIPLIDAGFSDDHRPYLCMELLDGEDLTRRIEREGALPAATAYAVFDPLCDALAMAHQLGIIHRDIKAANVVICRPEPGAQLGRVVLLDFGIAKLSDALAPELTATHQSLGTPACMAPEQIQGARADVRTDIYALGGLLFHMLTGRTPFQDPSATMSQYLHLHARRPRASLVVEVSPRLDDVISRAMAIDPGERFPDVTTMLAAVRVALHDGPATAEVTRGEAIAISISVVDRAGGAQLDAELLDDLESVLPAIERFLSLSGFALGIDLGTRAVFVAPATPVREPLHIALAAWNHLEQRRGRDPRVQIGIAVHREQATFVGEQVQAPTLLRPCSWQLPEDLEGVWVTSAFDPNAPTGRRLR
jgi:eukaryotic-like serine/threonine-protein kinase